MREYLIIGDQFLWFGMIINHSLMNPNQSREINIPVHDNPLDTTTFGIEVEKYFTPFTSKGEFISFESRLPKEWEEQNLPVILLTGDQWDHMNMELGSRTREQAELMTVK